MHVVITYALTASLILGTLMTIGRDMVAAFGDISDSWDAMVSRSQVQADTRISGPIGLSVSATSTVTMTLANEGDVTLGRFADWDAIMEVGRDYRLKPAGTMALTRPITAPSSPTASAVPQPPSHETS